jgi:predicted AAA+ superfamily ATPase
VVIPRPDLGQRAENVAFLELKKNHPAVYYWQGKQEVDFVVLDPRQETKLKLYNVSYTDEPYEREERGLVEGLKEFRLDQGTVLTKNRLETKVVEDKKIDFVPLWAWLITSNKTFFKEK